MSNENQKDKIEIQFIEKFHCNVCGKDYGRTNLLYNDCEVWQACGCQKDNKAYFINLENLRMTQQANKEEK